METYKNPYTKEEDKMLWELHEIRHKIASQNLTSDQINQMGKKVALEFNLKILSEDEVK